MAWAARRPCTWPGCGELTDTGRCLLHRTRERRQLDSARGSAASRGYDSKWQTFRQAFLLSHPLCTVCHSRGVIRQATVVDHIVPHKGNQKLFWDQKNLQSLCSTCHNSKTATQGRWG